jgi:hypothetical protein
MKIHSALLNSLVLAASLAGPQAFSAVVTTPTGTLTHSGAGSSSDPLAAGTWIRSDVRDGSSIGITSTYSRNGNGSFEFTGASGTSKADAVYYADFGTLGGFTGASYDWYRDSASTVGDHLQIAFRLLYDNDGDITTTGDQGALVFEQAYNAGGAATPAAWVTSTIDLTPTLWQSSYGNGNNEIYNRNLSVWTTYTQTGPETAAGQDQLSASTWIIGISMGIGSGWSGTFAGAVDNVSISSSTPGASSLSATNFEVVPEPSACLLGALGLIGLLRRRR